MTLAELLADAARRLDRAAITYMVTGSFASTYYGEPRATRDLDIVIEPSNDELGVLVDDVASDGYYVDRDDVASDGYYVDRDAAFDALRQRTQFDVVAADAFKIDLIIRKDRPFSREEFARRRSAVLLDTPVFIASVEDMIIAKSLGVVRRGRLDGCRQPRQSAVSQCGVSPVSHLAYSRRNPSKASMTGWPK